MDVSPTYYGGSNDELQPHPASPPATDPTHTRPPPPGFGLGYALSRSGRICVGVNQLAATRWGLLRPAADRPQYLARSRLHHVRGHLLNIASGVGQLRAKPRGVISPARVIAGSDAHCSHARALPAGRNCLRAQEYLAIRRAPDSPQDSPESPRGEAWTLRSLNWEANVRSGAGGTAGTGFVGCSVR